ncbi:unnamed protein product [Rotaria socialis]|uniref:EF-hand domain-containing protein n=1 Tax=Rotaria socialis TaxID=392032 RepID=A0A821N3Y2_9BILA|nr:unnamed protein product [Rotaria socialis]CAF3302642.1 unnamed protein product [Rotaria socialis]CAF3322147.1 unnamed protein product [Rotaria socialis]CAF3333430.1 unnamed protein product [Rotaria socialis]CAF3600763.1 unnamed protein product [Rotaria socialis]
MSSEGNHRSSFHHADTNHNGEAFSSADSAGPTETLTYEIGLDVAVAGFTQNPIEYEKYTQSANSTKGHTYGVGPDVGIGAPHVARTSNQYDPAAAMFHFADVNSDGRIDQGEFGSFMRSV